MKKIVEIGIWAGIAALCLLLAFVFFLTFKGNVVLKKELDQKKEELKVAQKASRKLADLEKQADELLQREKKLQRQVARQEYRPFALIRTITKTGTKTGLRAIRFEVLPPVPTGETAFPGVTEVQFRMDCQATFPQMLTFLKEVEGLERIVAVRAVDIKRQPETIPYQSVVVTLATYTFPE